jgi:3-phenylpropionate/cinnamic acid dioxygenase small subunit
MTIREELTALIIKEARLLDDRDYDAWYDLLAENALYWLPIDENADPRLNASIIHERKPILALRVEQLVRQKRLAENPYSATLRQVTNIEIDEQALSARYALVVIDLRSGDWRQGGLGQKRFFSGTCFMDFEKSGDSWKIATKKLVLMERFQPVEGLSFIL